MTQHLCHCLCKGKPLMKSLNLRTWDTLFVPYRPTTFSDIMWHLDLPLPPFVLPYFFSHSFVFTPVHLTYIWLTLIQLTVDCALYVGSYIRLCQQGDPHSFLFVSPARYVMYSSSLLHKWTIFGSPASTLWSLRTHMTLRMLLRTTVALTVFMLMWRVLGLGASCWRAPHAPDFQQLTLPFAFRNEPFMYLHHQSHPFEGDVYLSGLGATCRHPNYVRKMNQVETYMCLWG